MWYLSAGGRGLDSTAPRAHRDPPWDLRGTQTLEPLRCLGARLAEERLVFGGAEALDDQRVQSLHLPRRAPASRLLALHRSSLDFEERLPA